MTYDPITHRQQTRVRLQRLVAGGPGWHDYALAEAAKLEKEDPTLHEGLTEFVRTTIAAQKRQTTTPTRRT